MFTETILQFLKEGRSPCCSSRTGDPNIEDECSLNLDDNRERNAHVTEVVDAYLILDMQAHVPPNTTGILLFFFDGVDFSFAEIGLLLHTFTIR